MLNQSPNHTIMLTPTLTEPYKGNVAASGPTICGQWPNYMRPVAQL